MDSRPALFRWIGLLLIALAAVPLAIVARRADAFGPETRASDFWFRTRPARAPRADFILVARDQRTLDAIGQPGHAEYGALIRRLKAAGARWIVLDLDVDGREGHAADQALWTAIADSHRTLVLVRYAADRSVEPDKDTLRALRALEKSAHWQEIAVKPGTPQWEWLKFAPATSDFIHSAHGAGVAVTEQSLDPDQVMRRSRAGYLTRVLYPADTKQGKLTNYYAVVPSLPVISAISAMLGDKYVLDYRFGERVSLGGRLMQPFDAQGRVPVDYVGPAGTYPRVSMADVLRGQSREDLFKDRIVFVGSTVPNDPLSEYRQTPYGSPMARVEITANQTQSFLDARPLVEPHVAGFWGVLGLGVLLGLLVPQRRAFVSILAALGALALYLLAGWLLFWTRSVMLPVLPALLLTVGAVAMTALLAWAMRPYAEARVVEVRDTGMALGPDEALPEPPRRRWPSFRRRGPGV